MNIDTVLYTASNGIVICKGATTGSEVSYDPDDPSGGPRYFPCLEIWDGKSKKTFPVFSPSSEGANAEERFALEECRNSAAFKAYEAGCRGQSQN